MAYLSKKEVADIRKYPYPEITKETLNKIKKLNEKSIYIIPKQIAPKPFNYPPSVILGYFGRGQSKQLSDREYTGRKQHAEMWADIQQRYRDAYGKVFNSAQ